MNTLYLLTISCFNIAAAASIVGSCKGQQSPAAITRSQLRTFGQQRVAGAIPDLRPSLDSERTTLITGVGSSLQVDPVTLGTTSILRGSFQEVFSCRNTRYARIFHNLECTLLSFPSIFKLFFKYNLYGHTW